MTSELTGSDLYLRHTDKSGHAYVQVHRVWDAVRFFEAANERAAKDGGHVLLSSETDYRKQREPKR
jgi:hypothetical protein